jgi:hypothetical protein
MTLNSLVNGLGGITGDSVVTAKPYETTGQILWVSSLVGDGGNSGLDRENPLDTAVAAVSVSAPGDTIVLMDGHTETVATSLALQDGQRVIGEGSSAGCPTVKLTSAATYGGQSVFTLTSAGAGAEIRNIWFPTAAASNGWATAINTTEYGVRIIGCYFEVAANDRWAAVEIGASCGVTEPDYCLVRNCTFISTATSRATRGDTGLLVSDPTAHLWLDGCVFSDGTNGYLGDFALTASGLLSYAKCTDCSFLLGASAYIASESTIDWSGTVTTGGGRIYYA